MTGARFDRVLKAFPYAPLLALAGTLGCRTDSGRTVGLSAPASPRSQFAVEHIAEALNERGRTVSVSPDSSGEGASAIIELVLLDAGGSSLEDGGDRASLGLQAEGFRIEVDASDGPTYRVVAREEGGLMYGGLELAEQIKLYGLVGVEPVERNPYMEMRGVKFNIPLDARTPSYTDMGDSGQRNIPVVWEFGFWREFLDRLATYRYNFVSLWSLHPFPSMVRVPDYPDVALDDVRRSTADFQEYYSTLGLGMDDAAILDNLETVAKLTIDEKIAFWNRVMEYAADRNIRFYIVTWNVFVNGTDGKYGITDAVDNPTTIDYFRKSVKEMFVAYPLLAGIGLTTGENMPGASFAEKEEWAFQTYGQGIIDAATEFPNRQITFIHRQHQAGATAIAERFRPMAALENVDMIFSFKYAQAHVYSSTTQDYHHDFVGDIGDMKTIWTLRNDDVYQYRWGAPDFVREFIEIIPYDVGRGYYFGSDQWIWAREFLSLDPSTPRELEISKHWYQWMLWGRLGYEPSLDDDRLAAILAYRFPDTDASALFEAWQEASMVYPVVTGFHWGEFDYQWYIEACKSRPGPANTESGFHDVNRFITLPPHPSTDFVSIPDYVEAVTEGRAPAGVTPPQVVQRLHGHADRVMQLLSSLGDGGDDTLARTLRDIRTISLMGKYYAHKIQGATELALFRATAEEAHRDAAVAELTQAAGFWNEYTDAARSQYENPFWTNRVGYIDWDALTSEVEGDIELARASGTR
jgi:hypothetical protein